MSTYQLSIITPNGKVFNGQVESIVATGLAGSLGVLAGHAPMVVALKNGPLKFKSGGGERCLTVGSGILEVTARDGVMVLCDFAVEKSSR